MYKIILLLSLLTGPQALASSTESKYKETHEAPILSDEILFFIEDAWTLLYQHLNSRIFWYSLFSKEMEPPETTMQRFQHIFAIRANLAPKIGLEHMVANAYILHTFQCMSRKF